MEVDKKSRKRFRNSTIDENNDEKRIKSSRTSEQFHTKLEDVSNDILYEIFEYLDFAYLYATFLNLNQRFYNLISHPQIPVKIDTSSISNERFSRYFIDLIEPNIHQIQSIYIRPLFDMNVFFSSSNNLSKFVQLKIVVLDELQMKYFDNLAYLKTLPRLSILIVRNNDYDEDKSQVYDHILSLPVLKYCQLSLQQYNRMVVSHLSTDKYSSLEQLVINNSINLDLLHEILLCVPQLRHLSVRLLSESKYTKDPTISFPLNQLTHVSFRNCSISFEDFALLTKTCFHNLQVLRINTNAIRVYLDANQWECLISSSMPKLRIFDFQHRHRLGCHVNHTIRSNYQTLTDKFTSPFWIDRQWLFDTEEICVNGYFYYIFYSKTSNKNKQKSLLEENRTKICIDLFLQSWL